MLHIIVTLNIVFVRINTGDIYYKLSFSEEKLIKKSRTERKRKPRCHADFRDSAHTTVNKSTLSRAEISCFQDYAQQFAFSLFYYLEIGETITKSEEKKYELNRQNTG